MRVIVSCSRRFNRTPDGIVWTASSDDYGFWQQYLSVFDEALIIGRVQDLREAGPTWKPVGGPGVSIGALPNYRGLSGYVKNYVRVIGLLRQMIHRNDAVVLRIPSHVGDSMETILRVRQHPYGAEVVGDIAAATAPGSIDHVLRPLLRISSMHTVRRQCRNARTIAYVTRYTLQQLYPPSAQAFTTHYSSIQLPDDSIAFQPRVFDGTRVRLVSVGSMALKYKRFDVLIEAVKQCVAAGLDLSLTLIGDGETRPFLENLAHDLGDRVVFLGELPGSDAVRERLLKADLFVHASASEGLPRVIIEAMAVGLPCIGTTVGGTPELLPVEDMVSPNDVQGLAAKIQEVSTSPERLWAMSQRNLLVARQYAASELSKRREAMYACLRETTQEWVQRH